MCGASDTRGLFHYSLCWSRASSSSFTRHSWPLPLNLYTGVGLPVLHCLLTIPGLSVSCDSTGHSCSCIWLTATCGCVGTLCGSSCLAVICIHILSLPVANTANSFTFFMLWVVLPTALRCVRSLVSLSGVEHLLLPLSSFSSVGCVA
jgi:hypothetical protein